jgi:hypothetical protein
MQQADPADSTASAATSGGNFDRVSVPLVMVIADAMTKADTSTGELTRVSSLLRMMACAAEDLTDSYGIDAGMKRAIGDMQTLLYLAEEQIETLRRRIDDDHETVQQGVVRLRRAA